MNYISDHKIRNTHSHHLPEQAALDLEKPCAAIRPAAEMEESVQRCQISVDGRRRVVTCAQIVFPKVDHLRCDRRAAQECSKTQ